MYEYMCVCMHSSRPVLVRSIWNGLGYFWSPEERSRDGVWSQNRGSSLLLGMGVRVEWSGDEEQFTVDVLLPCRQFMTYC